MYQVHKISLLAKSWQSSSEVSPLAKFRSRRPNFAISEYLPLVKLHQRDFAISEVIIELQKIQVDKGHVGNSIGAEANSIHFANSEIFGY